MKQQILTNSEEEFSTYIYEDGKPIIPHFALATVSKPGRDFPFLRTETKIAEDGKISFKTEETNNLPGENYKVIISYTYKNEPEDKVIRFYDVVDVKLESVINDSDITGELPQLKGSGWKVMGTAKDCSRTIMKDPELKDQYKDNYFQGGTIYNINLDELREIIGSNETGEVCFRPFAQCPPAASKYILTRSFKTEIEKTFEDIEKELHKTGHRPSMILDPYDFKEAHIHLAVATICRGIATDDGDFWYKMWMEYEKSGEALLQRVIKETLKKAEPEQKEKEKEECDHCSGLGCPDCWEDPSEKKYDLSDPEVWRTMPREDFDILMKGGSIVISEDIPETEIELKINIEKLQAELLEWEMKNFGEQDSSTGFMGMVEELGELSHAILKSRQGIRQDGTDFELKKKDAIGDIFIYMASYCNSEGYSLSELILNTWKEVKKRDWKENPKDGRPPKN